MPADETLKRLLVRLGLDTSQFKSQVQDIRKQLNEVNAQAKRDAAVLTAEARKHHVITLQEIDDQKRMQAEARTMLSLDQAKAQWEKKNQEAIRVTVQQRILETTELKKQQIQQLGSVKLNQEKLRLAQSQLRLEQMQTRELERQQRQQQAGGGLFGRLAQAVTGRGLVGSIAGGLLVGGGSLLIIEQLIAGVKQLGHALTEASGPAQQLRAEFEKLTAARGIDPTVFVRKLNTAARGMIEDTKLQHIAINFLRSNMKVTSDQMVTMISNTINLARAMGIPAEQAANALERAFLNPQRGMMALARTTGISVDVLRRGMMGIPLSMDPATRSTIMFNKILEETEKMLKRVGVPATTLPELMKQMHVVQLNFIGDMAKGVLEGGGFGKTIGEISQKLIELQRSGRLTEIAETIGHKLADGIKFVVDHLDELKIALEALLLLKVGSWATEIAAGLGKMAISIAASVAAAKTAQVIGTAGGAAAGVGVAEGAVVGVGTGIGARLLAMLGGTAGLVAIIGSVLAALGITWILTVLKGNKRASEMVPTGTAERVITGYGRGGMPIYGMRQRLASVEELEKQVVSTGLAVPRKHLGERMNTGKSGEHFAAPEEQPPTPMELRQIAQARAQAQQAAAKLAEDVVKAQNEKQREDMQQSYELGLIDLKKYTQDRLGIEDKAYEAQKVRLKADYNAHVGLWKAKKDVTVDGQIYPTHTAEQSALARQAIDNRYKAQSIELETAYQKKVFDINQKEQQDELVAKRIHIDSLNKLAMEGVQERTSTLETEFKQGIVDADDYISQRKSLIDEEYNITIKGLAEKRKAAKNNLQELEIIDSAEVEAGVAWQKQFTKVVLSEGDIRLQNLVTQHDRYQKYLSATLKTAEVNQRPTSEKVGIIRESILANSSYISQLKQQQTLVADQPVLWEKIATKIAEAKEKQFELNKELFQAKDISASLAGLFGKLAGVIGSFKGTGAQNVAGWMQSMQGILSQGSKAQADVNQYGGGKGLLGSIGSSFKSIFRPGDKDESGNALDSWTKKLGESEHSIGDFIKGIGVMADAAMSFVKGITSGKSGGEGALHGLMAGAQTGSMFGPWGAAIGAGVGATLGGIFGHKEKQLLQDIHKIQDSMQSILDSMNEGAITLSQAIEAMRKEREQAIKILAQDPKGGKGGGKGKKGGYTPSQAQAVINQIDAQIAQLVNTQKQLLDQLNQQIAILANPLPFQQYVQSLDQIITKYQQFSNAAAGNAQEVANAQLYLNESLQAYVQTLGQQLNQAQQQAIQDALTLLNLEYQRQQIINQEAQQEYDILTQGVLTRQRTTAMTKGQQIGELRYQRDMQLMQIDEQIALQQYKVQTEQMIFGLATTRIGLEMQLLSLQEEAAGVQNQQTAALLQVFQQLQGAMASGSLMNALAGLGPTGTGTGLLTTLLGALGLGGYVPSSVLTGVGGATNYLSQIPQPYQSITNFINNIDPNFLMNLWNAMQTPPGSAQRQYVLSEAQPYQKDADTSGYDFESFAQWIQSGGEIKGTTATVTNYPAPTGPSQLPTGTSFPMPTGTGYSPSSISSYGGGGTSPYDAVTASMNSLNTTMSSLIQSIKNWIASLTGIPQHALGGYVQRTGLIFAHQGEYINPKGNTESGSNRADVEGSLFDMTSKRTAMEMVVISARQDQINMEMNHLQVLNETMDRISQLATSGGIAGSLESQFAQLYETRGRYGSGGFRRTVL